jgi:hypothetical protein
MNRNRHRARTSGRHEPRPPDLHARLNHRHRHESGNRKAPPRLILIHGGRDHCRSWAAVARVPANTSIRIRMSQNLRRQAVDEYYDAMAQRYAREYFKFLQENNSAVLEGLRQSGELNSYLSSVGSQASEMFMTLMMQYSNSPECPAVASPGPGESVTDAPARGRRDRAARRDLSASAISGLRSADRKSAGLPSGYRGSSLLASIAPHPARFQAGLHGCVHAFESPRRRVFAAHKRTE